MSRSTSSLSSSSLSTSRRRWPLLLAVLVGVVVVALLALAIGRRPAPEAALELDRPGLGSAPLVISARAIEPSRGVASLRLELVQGERSAVLAEASGATRSPWAFFGGDAAPLEVEARATRDVLDGLDGVDGLEEGEAIVRLTAVGAGGLLRGAAATTVEERVPVRFGPPPLRVLSNAHYVTQGGSGLVVYRVGDEALAEGGRDGVRAGGQDGEWFFPGRPLPGGEPGERVALFGVPWDLDEAEGLALEAEDALGNRSRVRFLDGFTPSPPSRDTITVGDAFLERVVPEIMARTDGLEDRGSLLANYLEINGELRARNAATLVELARRSTDERHWEGALVPLPGGAVMSSFADRRTYIYEGEEVDRQTHLGYDLASVRRAPVPAAADGVVVLAGWFGIYGNTVVVDHGWGLATLSSHLSEVAVVEGDRVERGDLLGRTGETGLAGGDHLHFTVLVGGLPVDPVEWWDPAWVRDRVLAKLEGE